MKKIICIITLSIMILSLSACGSGNESIEIGHKNFTEQRIIGQMLAIMIEEKMDKTVNVTEFGGTNVAFEALKTGEIDMYPDYTGTAYGAILGESELKDPNAVYEHVKKVYKEKYDVEWGVPLGFNNTYTLAVRPEIAEKYDLKSLSDLSAVANELVMISTTEFLERSDGLPGVVETYGGFDFSDTKSMDPGLRYAAIDSKQGQVMDAFSTDGKLIEFDLVVLEDDKGFFPPYYVAPIFNGEFAKDNPEIYKLLLDLGNTVTDKDMQQMNYEVDTMGKSEKDVAEVFLKSKGLIN